MSRALVGAGHVHISIALATYNGSRFLREQLYSLAEQTLVPAELVVSDDGSTDDTLALVRDFAAAAPFPVRILDKRERLGFADNFLNAAEQCRHDLIAFCDQDDVWLPNKLELAAKRLVEDDSLLALHTLTLTDVTLKPTGVIWNQEIRSDRAFEALELDPYATGWGNSMLFRRELVHLIPRGSRPRQPERPEKPLSHDTWIYWLAAALGRVSHITAPLILYRQHGANAEGFEVKAVGRLAKMTSVPLYQFQEQAVARRSLALILAQLGQRPGPFSDAAAAAAARLSERGARWAARAGLYDGRSFASRLQSFREHQRLADSPQPLPGRFKDLVLGVGGLHRAIHGRRTAPAA